MSSSRVIRAAMLAVLAAGCAQNARELPPDYGSVRPQAVLSAADFSPADRALSCEEIATRIDKRVDDVAKAEAVIRSDRPRNQVAGYLAALFLVPIVAIDTNDEQVAQIKHGKARIDDLRRLSRWRSCA